MTRRYRLLLPRLTASIRVSATPTSDSERRTASARFWPSARLYFARPRLGGGCPGSGPRRSGWPLQIRRVLLQERLVRPSQHSCRNRSRCMRFASGLFRTFSGSTLTCATSVGFWLRLRSAPLFAFAPQSAPHARVTRGQCADHARLQSRYEVWTSFCTLLVLLQIHELLHQRYCMKGPAGTARERCRPALTRPAVYDHRSKLRC